jgi:flavin reductase (DIM6/NTAB) family NADH-FMN oxidoreductase RutF
MSMIAVQRRRSVVVDGDFTVHEVAGYLEPNDPSPPPGAPVEGEVFKLAMRVLAAGVVIVTTRVDGRPWGLTISSCCSLSLEPPQIVVGLRSDSVSCQQILASGRFGASILAADQKALAERGAAVGVAKFMDEEMTAPDGEELRSPRVSGALFHLDCSVAEHHTVSDHELVVGYVHHGTAAQSESSAARPLLYFDRQFWAMGDPL